MNFLVRDKSFYRRVALIAIPIAAQNLINFGTTMADTVMLGMLGDVELSSAACANQFWFVFLLFTFGVGSGSGVMIAQFWGKGELEPIRRIMGLMHRLVIIVSVLFAATAVLFPAWVMGLFTDDPMVIEVGAQYLGIVGYSYVLAGITTSTVFALRSMGTVRIPVIVYSCSLATSVTLNWVLIFGNLGAPALGVRGAAISTFIARCVELAIIFIYILRFERNIKYRPRYIAERDPALIRAFAKTATPVVFNEVLWASGIAASMAIIGRVSTQFVAAYSVTSTLNQLIMVLSFGIAQAAAVIIGNTIGAGGRRELVERYAKTFMLMSVAMGLTCAGMVLLIRGAVIDLYQISPLAKIYAYQIMGVYAVQSIFQSFTVMSLIGILRGGGDNRFVLMVDTGGLWLVALPIGFMAGIVLGWPVPVIYAALKCDEIMKCFVSYYRVQRMEWVNDVTKF